MEYRGVYEDGMIRPTDPVPMPNGTPVEFYAVSESTRETIERSSREFFANKSLEQLQKEHPVKPINDIKELAIDWPPEDDIDEFLRQVRQGRV